MKKAVFLLTRMVFAQVSLCTLLLFALGHGLAIAQQQGERRGPPDANFTLEQRVRALEAETTELRAKLQALDIAEDRAARRVGMLCREMSVLLRTTKEPEWSHIAHQQRAPIVELEIFGFAQSYAASRGFRFGNDSGPTLQRKVRRAADQIVLLPDTEQLDQIWQAKENFKRVIDEMISASRRIPGYSQQHPGVIGEATLNEALRMLCPLWPFCS